MPKTMVKNGRKTGGPKRTGLVKKRKREEKEEEKKTHIRVNVRKKGSEKVDGGKSPRPSESQSKGTKKNKTTGGKKKKLKKMKSQGGKQTK